MNFVLIYNTIYAFMQKIVEGSVHTALQKLGIYMPNFLSGVFTAGIFLPGLIILANLLSGVFTAAGITETPKSEQEHYNL